MTTAVMHVNVLDFILPPCWHRLQRVPHAQPAYLPTPEQIPWRSEAGNVIPRAQSLPKHPANIFRLNDIRSLARLAPHDACALTLILALTVVVVLIARDQQDKTSAEMEILNTGRSPHPDNLASIVDIACNYQMQT